MKLIVKNLGAISQAEVDLSKDLILLTGENNTGKTYLAYTIYGLCEFRNEFLFEGFEENTPLKVVNLEERIAPYLAYFSRIHRKNDSEDAQF